MKVLIAEDEADIRELIHFHLFKNKHEVFLASNGEEALTIMRKESPDFLILDIMMPKIDGLNVCIEARKESSTTINSGIILLTAKGSEEDIIKGLENGADDYVTKPFSPKVLLARVQAVSNRRKLDNKTEKDIFYFKGLKIDKLKRKVHLNSEEIILTYTEFQLLELLLKGKGIVFTRSQIVTAIHGNNHAITDRSVDVQVVGLRKKLRELGKEIETVRGVGYRLTDE